MLDIFTELTQRASDVSTWHITLDALLCDEYGGSENHKLLRRNDSATKLTRMLGKLRHVRSDWLSGSRTSET